MCFDEMSHRVRSLEDMAPYGFNGIPIVIEPVVTRLHNLRVAPISVMQSTNSPQEHISGATTLQRTQVCSNTTGIEAMVK